MQYTSSMIEVRQLLWDDWNIEHIARHSVVPREVAEVCHGDVLALTSHTNRIIVFGLTAAGRILAVELSPQAEAGVYYVVMARTASNKE